MTSVAINPVFYVDDAMPGATIQREAVLRAGFRDETLNGQTYHGINASVPEGWQEAIERHIGIPIDCKLSFFCLSGEDHHLESGAYIHCDKVFADHAAIVYLSDPETISPDGGTAFWRHRERGWTTMPSRCELEEKGLTVAGFIEDWKHQDRWDLVGLAQEKFNRLAIFDANRFHSRYPLRGRGTTPENSRLIWTTWFNYL